MKLFPLNYRTARLATTLPLLLSVASAAWGKPSIESLTISPNPISIGQVFTVTVVASSNVTDAAVAVDFHQAQPAVLDVPLTRQGNIWTGIAAVPEDIQFKHDKNDNAEVKALVIDNDLHTDKKSVKVDVEGPTISAVFADGVLTVTGDDKDNTLIVSRTPAGTIVVNGGAVPITGGVPTVTNTSLIQMFGFAGNDVLTVDDSNGPMPSANLFGGEGDDILTGSAADDMLDGGPGNDTLNGRGGNDKLFGGPGNDILIGGPGTDEIHGGDGDDIIIWNPGDGSDIVEGDAGNNTLLFNGANINEIVDLSANGPRLRFFRNVANITMDCDGIQQVVFNALGGADQVTVNDLTGTKVTNVVVDLSTPAGSGIGDHAADTIIVNGTTNNDNVMVAGSTNGVSVFGLAATVTVLGSEPTLDSLVINGLAGNDTIDASALPANLIKLTLNGGDGDDTLIGSQGDDLLIGGRGNDVMFGRAGDDTFIWNPGDGSDIIEGEEGHDTMVFNGANVGEHVDLSANGSRLRFFRDVANITMDCNGVEAILFNALSGADTITVNDLTGTDVTTVNLDLSAVPGSNVGDNLPDTVIVNATTNDDVVTVSGNASGVTVAGLQATVNIFGSDPLLDELIIKLLDGDDVLNASGLAAGVIHLNVDGGPGNDVIIGSPGDDELHGGEGDDILNGNGGQDLLDGGPGNNVLIP